MDGVISAGTSRESQPRDVACCVSFHPVASLQTASDRQSWQTSSAPDAGSSHPIKPKPGLMGAPGSPRKSGSHPSAGKNRRGPGTPGSLLYRYTRPFIASAIIFFLLTILIHSASGAPAKRWLVQREPVRVVNGSPVLFRVPPPFELNTLKAEFLGQELEFRFSSGCHCWYAIGGVSLETKPGRYELRLAGQREKGQ